MPTSAMPARRVTRPRAAVQSARRRRGALRAALTVALAAALVAGTLTVAQARTGNPYQRGPAPTVAGISAARGPFATTQTTIEGDGDFGAATVYYPTSTRQGKYGVVGIVPGFFGEWSWMDWLGPRLASQGFVVVGVDTNLPWDLPDDRAAEVVAGIAAARRDPKVARVGDFSRVALSGWSMGGGGVLDAAVTGSYKAIIPIAPWETDNQFAKVTEPTLIIGGQLDAVAPDATMAVPFYTALKGRKAFIELARADHFFTTDASAAQAAAMIAWLKRFVDNDTRYTRFICPRPAVNHGAISAFRSAC